uniref:VWFA domain-containing protein n=1 Tax=Oryza punctata TaxID=4537 RepID=A0A0E0MHQ7_ORYPU
MSQAQAENAVQVAAYAKVDAIDVSWPRSHPGSIPVLVRVVAPPATSGRAPIDLVAVLDVSCGGGLGPVNRIDLLEKAMKLITGKLSKDDRLAIVPVQASTGAVATEKYDLRNMDANGREAAITWVKSLVPAGDNKLSTGLNKAAEILKGRDEKEKKRPGFIILISDGDDRSVLRDDMNLNCSVHAFGFRDAHNPWAMYRIANTSAGTYGILNDGHDGLTDAFATSINNIASIVAVDAVINISCSNDSTLKLTDIESGRFKEYRNGEKSGTILAGALQAGAVRSFIVYVDIPAGAGADELEHLSSMLTVGVQYEDRSTSQQAESQVQEITTQTAKAVVVKDGDEYSRLVAAEILRVEAIRIVGEVIQKYGDNGRALADAADELHKQWRRLKQSEYATEAAPACFVSALDAEMEEMETTLRRSSGMSYMLSWQTCHSLQHLQHARSSSSSTAAAKAKGSSSVPAAGAAARQSFTAGGAAMGKFVWSGAHHGGGGGERKRKYYYEKQSTELEMIEQRLAYWSKVKCELPPMHDDGDCPDHMTTIFRDASRESIDRAMFHDVFLAPAENTVQVTAYAKVDAADVHGSSPEIRHPGIPVLIRVVAPPATSESARAPIDLVAVLDVSCCCGGGPTNRMDLLKRAMELVIDKMSSQDRLAIVPVQASSAIAGTYHTTILAKRDNQSSANNAGTNGRTTTTTSATEKDKNSAVGGKEKITPAVGEGDQSSFNVSEKVVLLNMDAEGRIKAVARVQSLAAAGDNKLSTALEKAVKILEGRKEVEKNRAGFIVLISDGDDSSIFRATMNPTYSVHAFGFRGAHNARALHFIANTSTGTYGVLNDEHDGITDAFAATIDSITSIVVVQTVVNISSGGEPTAATLLAIESGRFRSHIDDDRKSGFVMAGALHAGAVRSFLVYVDHVGDGERDKLPSLLTVRVEYVNLSSASENSKEMKLDAQVVIVRKGDENSRMVAAEIIRVEAMRIVGEILDRYKDNGKGFTGAADELHEQWRRLMESSEYGGEAGDGDGEASCPISGLAAEIKEMEDSIRRCSGVSYMLSWQTRHSLQHQTRTHPKAAAAAATAAVNGSPAVAGAPPRPSPYIPKPNAMATGGAQAAQLAARAAAMVATCGGGVERKRKYQSTELEMIEQRLAYWLKVKHELPPMHQDGEWPDHMTAIFREASGESIDRAMYHDVFLVKLHASY